MSTPNTASMPGLDAYFQASPVFTFNNVDVPGDTFTQLLGVNNFNEVVGYHGAAVNQGETLVLPSTFTSENFPGSVQTQVVGINGNDPANVVNDGFFVDATGVTHGFIDNNGTFNKVDAPNAAFTQLLGINDIGQEAGYSSIDPTGATNQRAFIVQPNGQFQYLNLPTNINSQTTGVNDLGQAVGFIQTSATSFSGYIYQNGQTTLLNAPGAIATEALGINDLGDVVGDFTDSSGATRGFVYTHGQFTTVDAPGAKTTVLNGINDFERLLQGLQYEPNRLITDGLRSYGVARRALLPDVRHRTSRYLNNQAENSHRPTRRRERQMQRFKSIDQAQGFLSAHGIICGHFRPRRHRMTAVGYRRARVKAFRIWRQETCVHHARTLTEPFIAHIRSPSRGQRETPGARALTERTH